MTGSSISLTEGRSDNGERIDALFGEVDDVSPPVRNAHRDAIEALTERVLASDPSVPGASLEDDDDAAAFRDYVGEYCSEHLFSTIDETAAEAALTWTEVTRCVRRLAEALYLQSFQHYQTARTKIASVEQARRDATTAIEEIETARQRDGRAAEDALAGEESLADAVSRAESVVADAESDADTLSASLKRAHLCYAVAAEYREEYDIDPETFSVVSLSDDPDWYFQDLRHERDRIDSRVRWLRNDLDRISER